MITFLPSARSIVRIGRISITGTAMMACFSAALLWCVAQNSANARPSSKHSKGSDAQIQQFLRQTNVYSNIEFYYTNRGVLFNKGSGQEEGCFWPRGSGNSYIFGEGLWFATQKVIQGKRHKLCDLGYNPNSGAGWYLEGEASQVGMPTGTDGASPAAKYISYVGPRYDKTSGTYLPGSSTVVPAPYYSWPLWDTSKTKTLNRNYYFGDYISEVGNRNATRLIAAGSKPNPKPAITSEEDILNIYSDADYSNNPEWRANTGYPFKIDIQEEIYSWSFGRYRDMIFLRHKLTNASKDSLINCYMAPAFDPDLDAAVGGAAHDGNSYVDSNLVKTDADPTDVSMLRQPYRGNPAKLNMGVQWRDFTQPPNGQQYGWIGFSFLESPVIDSAGNIIPNDDSVGLHGYGPNSLFQTHQLGLTTFRDWIILNDPSTEDLRYNFVSSGEKDLFNGVYQDQRLLMSTGPFTLPPGKSVETVVGITIAQVDNSDYRKNFGALLLLADFAHQVFGEVDSSTNPDGTESYFVTHFVSPAPPALPTLTPTALDKAVLLTWDTAAEQSVLNVLPVAAQLPDTALPFLGYQLWRTTRSDHDTTIRPQGSNPSIMLGQWQLYTYRTDSVFDQNGHFNHFHYTRLNTTPNPIPHSYLDVGDNNHDGILTGSEGLLNNVTYYYYLVAYNEYDSLNKVGPLYTALVKGRNFVSGIPNKPVFLAPFSSDTASNIHDCTAGADNPKFGGVQRIHLDIVDTGIFSKLFTNDTINVSFQPRWVELNTLFLDQSYMQTYVDVTDTKKLPDGSLQVNKTYKTMQNPGASLYAYYFPTVVPGGTIVYHVDGTYTADSTFGAQFTTDNSTFAPNQTIDRAFSVLTDVNLEQLSAPYRLSAVSVSGNGDPNILRLSRRTNNAGSNDPNQNIYNLPSDSAERPPVALTSKQITISGPPMPLGQTVTRPQYGNPANDTVFTLDKVVIVIIDSSSGTPDTTGTTYLSNSPVYHYKAESTRPSFLGALGETTYQVDFLTPSNANPVAVSMPSGDVIQPQADSIKVSIASCPQSVLRIVPATTADSAADMTIEYDHSFYANTVTATNGLPIPAFTDPDSMHVPNPGWYEMAAFHYVDNVAFDQVHTGANFLESTVGPYYFPIAAAGNQDNSGNYHLTVHKLSVGGAEIIFNAPEISDAANVTGDTIAGNVTGHINPHMTDFRPGDKILLSFTGLMKNLPFPGAQFQIKTESGSQVSFINSGNYIDQILSQVQVVPNPYIVTHLGQTSTDNAKLFFTRLPPRCTIEIYALDGTLVATLEHRGYASTTKQDTNDIAKTNTSYDYSTLSDQSSVETWNLLTSGQQRVGSQVLFARVIAKDPNNNDAEIGEITTKFAVIVGLSK